MMISIRIILFFKGLTQETIRKLLQGIISMRKTALEDTQLSKEAANNILKIHMNKTRKLMYFIHVKKYHKVLQNQSKAQIY